MARRQSADSGHSAFTDHRIAARPEHQNESQELATLRAWRSAPEPIAIRNLGLANVLIGRNRSSMEHVAEGLRLLDSVKDRFQRDPDVLEAIGTALVLTGSTGGGRSYLRKALELEPRNPTRHLPLAAAWWEIESDTKAVAVLDAAIELDPYLESAYKMLARVYGETGQSAKARATWLRYLKHRPRSIEARQRLKRVK